MFSNSKRDSESDIELRLLSNEDIKAKDLASSQKPKSPFIEFLNPETSPLKFRKRPSLLKFVTFFDIWDLLKSINTKIGILEPKDLPLSFSYSNIEQKIVMLDVAWLTELSKNKPSIVLAVIKTFKKECAILSAIYFVYATTKMYSFTLVGNVIQILTIGNFEGDLNRNEMLWSATLLAFATVIFSVLHAWFWHYSCILAALIRNTLTGFVYKKLQSVTLSSIQQLSIGKVVNILSNDLNEIDNAFYEIVPMAFSPYVLFLSWMILWRSFGWVSALGIIGLVVLMLLSNYLSKKTEGLRSEKSSITDSRIKQTNELIECIRLIRMYAWEKAFKKAIIALRAQEVIKLFKLKQISIIGEGLAKTSSQISLVL